MLTQLEIINDMLASTGTAPVSSASTRHPSYLKAQAKLDKANRRFQGKGYWFNRSTRTMRQSTAGEVILPGNTLSADPTDTTLNYVMRSGKLYDMTLGTYAINTDVEVDIVEDVNISDLPPTAANLLQAMAVLMYYVDEDGGEPKLSTYKQDYAQAAADFKQEDLKHLDINVFNGSSFARWRRPGRR